MCGIAGALYVPQVGIINPSEMSPANSIEIAIWTAVGGRGTLVGPMFGAAAVNGAQELVHAGAARVLAVMRSGSLFIVVTLFLPRGIAGLWARRVSGSHVVCRPVPRGDIALAAGHRRRGR